MEEGKEGREKTLPSPACSSLSAPSPPRRPHPCGGCLAEPSLLHPGHWEHPSLPLQQGVGHISLFDKTGVGSTKARLSTPAVRNLPRSSPHMRSKDRISWAQTPNYILNSVGVICLPNLGGGQCQEHPHRYLPSHLLGSHHERQEASMSGTSLNSHHRFGFPSL